MKNDFLNFFGKVSGRVQGVGYRTWTKKTAEYYGLYGWITISFCRLSITLGFSIGL